ncbi:Acid phosphatase 1 [Heracleum sosnowskyi]|uniref:Acid phosphatase 1 n=1 Tax=Heracleum sosnowskyi TaxID=360622 RepID=A0AAD8HHF2_9APIA|nr:Acid phosphatase 1 [Heracleum sosnowskyi]
METFYAVLLFLSLIYVTSCQENFSPRSLPRPLLVDLHKKLSISEDVVFHCTSWRFAIPKECKDYVDDYMNKKGYKSDLERVSKEARLYASTVELKGDGKDIWVFHVDETLLSNLPYYACSPWLWHEPFFGPTLVWQPPDQILIPGLEVFDDVAFDKWVDKGKAKAIKSSLKLYEELVKLGFKVFLLTGRTERRRNITTDNLTKSGFHGWEKLILRGTEDHGKPATQFKSEKRGQMVAEGYRIHGNSGDQWSDLLGSPVSVRSFKLPNPMYYIA